MEPPQKTKKNVELRVWGLYTGGLFTCHQPASCCIDRAGANERAWQHASRQLSSLFKAPLKALFFDIDKQHTKVPPKKTHKT